MVVSQLVCLADGLIGCLFIWLVGLVWSLFSSVIQVKQFLLSSINHLTFLSFGTINWEFLLLKNLLYCVSACCMVETHLPYVYVEVSWQLCAWSQFSPSIYTWVPCLELNTSGLAARDFTFWETSTCSTHWILKLNLFEIFH